MEISERARFSISLESFSFIPNMLSRERDFTLDLGLSGSVNPS
jgi:hypothetical protein